MLHFGTFSSTPNSPAPSNRMGDGQPAIMQPFNPRNSPPYPTTPRYALSDERVLSRTTTHPPDAYFQRHRRRWDPSRAVVPDAEFDTEDDTDVEDCLPMPHNREARRHSHIVESGGFTFWDHFLYFWLAVWRDLNAPRTPRGWIMFAVTMLTVIAYFVAVSLTLYCSWYICAPVEARR